MIVWTFACKIKSPRWQSPSWLSSVPPSLYAILCLMFSMFRTLCLHVLSACERMKRWNTQAACSFVSVCASGLSAPLAQISDRHFSWRRSLKSLPRQLGVRVSACLFMYAFVRVSAHLNPELQSPTTPSQHPLFNFLLLFFHSSVKTSRVGVDRGWLAKIADYSVCMSRSNICAFISIFFLCMWNSFKERRPLSLQ